MQAEDLHVADIAHHLTQIGRFGGVLDFNLHYSVAEHSLLMANYARAHGCDDSIVAYVLLHDASEAYLGDIVTGLKTHLPDYRRIEHKVQSLIYSKYLKSIPAWAPEICHELDKRIILNEVLTFVPERYLIFKGGKNPLNMGDTVLNTKYKPGLVPKQVIYDEFLKLCKELVIID